MSRILETIWNFLAVSMLVMLLTFAIGYFSGTKTDKDQHITCLELSIDKEKCKVIFDELTSSETRAMIEYCNNK